MCGGGREVCSRQAPSLPFLEPPRLSYSAWTCSSTQATCTMSFRAREWAICGRRKGTLPSQPCSERRVCAPLLPLLSSIPPISLLPQAYPDAGRAPGIAYERQRERVLTDGGGAESLGLGRRARLSVRLLALDLLQLDVGRALREGGGCFLQVLRGSGHAERGRRGKKERRGGRSEMWLKGRTRNRCPLPFCWPGLKHQTTSTSLSPELLFPLSDLRLSSHNAVCCFFSASTCRASPLPPVDFPPRLHLPRNLVPRPLGGRRGQQRHFRLLKTNRVTTRGCRSTTSASSVRYERAQEGHGQARILSCPLDETETLRGYTRGQVHMRRLP